VAKELKQVINRVSFSENEFLWTSGGSRILCLGGLTGQVFLFGRAKRGLSAEGAKLRLPKARSPSRLGGLRECRKLPCGSGAPPQKPTRFLTFYAKM